MTSQTLREARTYEEAAAKMIRNEERPAFHLSAFTGWMNDPNGFSYYNGMYHMFYQYHPYDAIWGPMHWGHAVSRDMLHWEFLPAAIAPDEFYDMNGCFSGSAVTLPDGRQLLMYTGVQKQRMPGGAADIQTQCLAVGDGLNYEKYEQNPVLDAKDIPEGCSINDFRDPKIWQEKDGTFRCVVGNRPADGSGQILLYRSEDAFNWKFEKVLIANHNRFGKMWECPDFFELDGKYVLLTSPQDMLPEGFEYHNGNGTLCLIGDCDTQNYDFKPEHDQAIDYGIDFYAPQTVLMPDGRRVMIGWMQNWDTCSMRMPSQPWFGQMSLPREISIENGRLYQRPLREMEELRTERAAFSGVRVGENAIELEGVHGRCVDLELKIRAVNAEDLYHKFIMRFAQDERFHTQLSFRPHESVLKIDRKFSGSRRAIIHQRRCKVNSSSGELNLRIILDRFSAEIFINDGEQVMTATLYTPQNADRISFVCDGEAEIDVVKYSLQM
ncbi:MAG: glycoside hydrolase family 32 protein [Lachnospiraceae bacterium]|nr:glycoside hydrolase family 32 protein [Lachnospiraceae bacterium]